jgi:hypothetical protein
VFGTIAGSLIGALVGALYQARLSKPRLQVKATWQFAMIGGRASPDRVGVNAANVGPLPMQVTGCGFRLNDKMQLALMQDDLGLTRLPADVQPGHSVEFRIFLTKIHEGLQEEADKRGKVMRVLDAYARDATGHVWHGPVKVRDLRAAPRRGPTFCRRALIAPRVSTNHKGIGTGASSP